MLHIKLLPSVPDGGKVGRRHSEIGSQILILISMPIHAFFQKFFIKHFSHLFTKCAVGGSIKLCGEPAENPGNILFNHRHSHVSFLASGQVQSLRGRPAGARPSGFHIKNQENLSNNIHGTRRTSSCRTSDRPSVV